MDSNFGREIGNAAVVGVIAIGVVCVVVGFAAAFILPWMWHAATAHVSFH